MWHEGILHRFGVEARRFQVESSERRFENGPRCCPGGRSGGPRVLAAKNLDGVAHNRKTFDLLQLRETGLHPEVGQLSLDEDLHLGELLLERVSFGFTGQRQNAAALRAGPYLAGLGAAQAVAGFPGAHREQTDRRIADKNVNVRWMRFSLLPCGWCGAGSERVFSAAYGQRLCCGRLRRDPPTTD